MKRIIDYLQDKTTKEKILRLIIDNLYLYQGIDTEEKVQSFSGLIYNQFVRECVQNNQYVSLSKSTIESINDIYKLLVRNLQGASEAHIDEVAIIVDEHRKRLIQALSDNEHTEETKQIIIPCSEYTAEFQDTVLRLDQLHLNEPIIDIGCGNTCGLVKSLRRNGYKSVYGIDQYISMDNQIICSNWFDFSFNETTWGTIISHMAYTNHFRRVVCLESEKVEQYTEKYHELLRALKRGGLLIYTPSVRVIEDAIDRGLYDVRYYRNMANPDLDTVHIQKRP